MNTEYEFEFEKDSSLDSKVYQAIGAASVCWESIHGTGVFQDQHAKAIADALIKEIKDYGAMCLKIGQASERHG